MYIHKSIYVYYKHIYNIHMFMLNDRANLQRHQVTVNLSYLWTQLPYLTGIHPFVNISDKVLEVSWNADKQASV